MRLLHAVNSVLGGAQSAIAFLQEIANLKARVAFLEGELAKAKSKGKDSDFSRTEFNRMVFREAYYILAAIEATKPSNPSRELGEAAKRLRELIGKTPGFPEEKNSARLMALIAYGLAPENK